MLLQLITCMAVIYAHDLHPGWLVAALIAWIIGQGKAKKLSDRVEYIEKVVRETVRARIWSDAS